jgi:hypothetical protein
MVMTPIEGQHDPLKFHISNENISDVQQLFASVFTYVVALYIAYQLPKSFLNRTDGFVKKWG